MVSIHLTFHHDTVQCHQLLASSGLDITSRSKYLKTCIISVSFISSSTFQCEHQNTHHIMRLEDIDILASFSICCFAFNSRSFIRNSRRRRCCSVRRRRRVSFRRRASSIFNSELLVPYHQIHRAYQMSINFLMSNDYNMFHLVINISI